MPAFKNSLSLSLLVICGLFASCNKNKLSGEYASFNGTYQWRSTGIVSGTGLGTGSSSFSHTEVNYTVAFEFNSKGEAVFYKNGAEVSRNKYRIQDKEANSYGGKQLLIKLKGKLNGLDIKDEKLSITLSGDTALTIDKFPFPAIDDMGNYKSGARSSSNHFIKN